MGDETEKCVICHKKLHKTDMIVKKEGHDVHVWCWDKVSMNITLNGVYTTKEPKKEIDL